MLGAISTPLQPLVSRCLTSAQIWTTLANTYAKPSRGHVKQLKNQLKNASKGSQKIDEYIQGITTKLDQLALLGKPYEHEDAVEVILDGLPEEYKPIVDQIESKDVAPSIAEIHERLLNHEAKILCLASTTNNAPITANNAQRNSNYRNQNYNNQQGPRSNNPNRRNEQNQQSQWRNEGSYNNSYNNNARQSNANNDGRQPRPYLGRCQICNTQGHSARRCPQFQPQQTSYNNYNNQAQPWQPRANYTDTNAYTSSNWLMDSGATHHMTDDLNNLSLHQPYTGNDDVQVADGNNLNITHLGSTYFPSSTRVLHLDNALCVPSIKRNLISVHQLCNSNNVSVEFFPTSFQVKDLHSGVPLLQGKTKDQLYEWPILKPHIAAYVSATMPHTSLHRWHQRMGHPSLSILKKLVADFSIPFTSSKTDSCLDCLLNKTHKLPFTQSTITSHRPLEYVFSDVWTSPILSVDNHKYYIVFVDHYSRYTWLFPLKRKSEVKETFVTFKELAENKFQTRMGTLFSDNGGEFIGLRSYLANQGISHLTSPPHTPEHNGISERKHRHIVETGLTLLNAAAVPKKYWNYAFSTAVYLINRMPTPVVSMKSPYVRLFRDNPNYDKLRVFGCLCFPWLRPYASHKLDDRSLACVFVGYSQSQSAYLCLHVETGRIYTSRHVKFEENTFPFASKSKMQKTEECTSESGMYLPMVTPIPVMRDVSSGNGPPVTDLHHTEPTPSSPQVLNSIPISPSTSVEPLALAQNESNSQTQLSPHSHEPTALTQNELTPTTQTAPQQNEPRSHQANPMNPRTQPHDSQISTTTPDTPPNQNIHKMTTRAKNNIYKPKTKVSLHAAGPACQIDEPTTIIQAMKDTNWRQAASAEFDAQMANHTWDLVPPKPHYNLIGSRWLFTKKYNADGSLQKYKVRLVAKGYTQQYGIDYAETFSPVIKTTTVRVVLQLATTHSWTMKQLDVNNAFLQGDLREEIYMTQPAGFVDKDRPDYVCRLRKPLYGLKQAPRSWYTSLKNYLVTAGFMASLADTSLFIKASGGTITYILVYVDDIIVTGNSNATIARVLSDFSARFSIKDPTDLHYFLGVEVRRMKHGIHLTQRKYIQDLLHRYNMTDAKPVATPLPASPKLTARDDSAPTDAPKYRSLVGSLQYLSFTRPDLAYSVNRLSHFMHKPRETHWIAAKRILRYLAGTLDRGITFLTSSKSTLHAYSDADWAGDLDDLISTNGYIIYIGNNPVSWSSKKQKGVARSSTEAEYRAIANTAAEVRWICSLLTELQVRLPVAPVIYCDNIGATYLCANPVFHSRMKHIALDYHFVRNQIKQGMLRVSHVSSKDQLADTLTKPLPRLQFLRACSKIGLFGKTPS